MKVDKPYRYKLTEGSSDIVRFTVKDDKDCKVIAENKLGNVLMFL